MSQEKTQPPGDRLAELHKEVDAQLPTLRQCIGAFQADPSRRAALEPVREVFHRLGGVAAPCGAPLLGALAQLTEELVLLIASGKLEAGPEASRALLASLKGVEAFSRREVSPPPAPVAAAQPVAPEAEANKILIVDDDPLSARLIEICLGEAGFSTRYCKDSRDAIAALDSELPDLILLDLVMPDQDGFETCRQIRALASSDRIPIIFLTRVSNLGDKVEALRSGGDDYMTKPFEPVELVARVRAHMQRHAAQREQIIRDAVTGAHSHRYFKQRLNQELRRLERAPGSLSLAMVDVDHFKRANDEHGHAAGDAILKGVVREALSVLRRTDLLGRYGGDEFAVVLPATAAYQAASLLERVAQRIAGGSFGPEGSAEKLRATVSVGLSEWKPGITSSALIEQADRALYEAKRRGRNRVVVAEDRADAGAQEAAASGGAGQLSILLVDDSRLTRDILKLYLVSLGVVLTDAENGAEALERIRKERPNLVLADLRMPRLDGLGLLHALRAEPAISATPVIILTGHLEPGVYDSCLGAGAKEVLVKPVEPVDLLNVVNKHLDRRSRAS